MRADVRVSRHVHIADVGSNVLATFLATFTNVLATFLITFARQCASPSVRRFIGMRPPHYASFSSGSRDFLSYRSHIADFEASSFRSGGSNGGSASVLSRPPRKACVSLAIGFLVCICIYVCIYMYVYD